MLAARTLEGFDAFAPPPMFAGKISMIHRNTTDAAEAADAAIEEIPGDFITRKDFIERVKLKLSENGVDAEGNKQFVDTRTGDLFVEQNEILTLVTEGANKTEEAK